MAEKIKLVLIGIFIALFSALPSGAVISESDDPSYILMATGINYTAYFSPMNTNGFKFVINDHSFIFLPRSISYTDEGGETTRHLGSAQDTQIQNTSDMIYFENAYGSGGQLRYLSNPLMIKEIYVLNELPTPSSNEDWMTLSSIAAFDNDLKLKYIDDSGVERSWDGTKIKTNEIKFYDASDKFQFELPQPLAKDALNNIMSGHYLIYEKDGIFYISARFSYASLANMTLPIYLDISLAEGKVAFGKSEYLIGETLEIFARGFAFSDERTLLYNPSNQVVKTFDWPNYAADDWWTSKYIHTADATGWWTAELQTWSWLKLDWEKLDTAYTDVKAASTPTPSSTPTPTPTPVPTTTPGPPGVLYGYIYDTSGNRVYGATIRVDTGQSYNDPNDYDYVMSVPSGVRKVTATASGYVSQTQGINVVAGRFNGLDFSLAPAAPPPDMTYRGSINTTKDEYYTGDTIVADAINLNTLQQYKIKWYENNAPIGTPIPVSSVSNTSTSVQVPADKPIGTEYKVELTKKDDSVLSSDTAEIVVRPRDVKIAVILAEPLDDSHNKSHDKNYYMTKIVRDLQEYYKEVSYGAVNIVINAADVDDNYGNWYKLGNTAAYYGKNITKIDANGTTYEDGLDNSYKFASHAAGVSKVIANNYDIVVVVHANKSWQEPPNNWDLMRTEISGDKYVLVSESELMGAWAHEIGHWMGKIFQPNKPPYYLPDVYALKDWDLMGSGDWLGDMKNPDHMSSYSKDWVGWLKNKSIYYPNTGTYWINSLVTMKYGDEITSYITRRDPTTKYINYYIVETRTNNPDYSKWDTSAPIPSGHDSALVLYQVDSAKDNLTVDFKSALTTNSGIASYWDDYSLKIRFSAMQERTGTIGSRKTFEIEAGISQIATSNYVGAVYTPDKNLVNNTPIAPSYPLNVNLPYPDTDLHAYTRDGKHVGINYTTGVYENQIPGAKTSADSFNALEWIFVPDNIKVQFTVDSREIGEFLNAYPSIKQQTSGIESYNLSIVYDDPNNIRYAANVEQSITPYNVKNYNYTIVKNMDGTYKVVLDYMSPLIFNTTPKNATNSSQVLAEFADNPDGSGIDSSSISLFIDGADVTRNATLTDSSISTKPVIKDGLHEVFLRVSDKAGNKATANWNFTLDTAPPEITISNVSGLTNQNVSPDIKVIDARDAKPTITVSLDGIVYDGSPISTEGEHTLKVVASDELGNTAAQNLNFTIDKTKPDISISGVSDGSYYNIDVTPAITITDTNLDTQSITLNGAAYTSGTIISAENDYALVASGTDKAGNSDLKTVNFVVDKTKPDISISGVSDGSYYNIDVTPVITITDSNLDTQSIMLNGAAYTSGTVISAEGGYALVASGTDKAGNSDLKTVNFVVDKTPPSISITGAENDGFYNISKTISYAITDNIDTSPLISANYLSGTVFNDENDYSVQITAKDHADNIAVKTLNFTIDKTPPIVNIASPNNDSYIGGKVKITGTATDLNIKTVSLEIDSISVTNDIEYLWDSTKVTDREHEIRLNAEDKAGNTASTSIIVRVDNTPPDILNIKPQNNAVVNNTYSISANYTDTGSDIDINSFSIWIDGIDETGDALVTNTSMQYKPSLQDGKHILKLSISDKVGNSKMVTTSFELDTASPDVRIDFPSNNSFVRQIITVSGIAKDIHLDTVSVEIDGIKVSSTSTYTWDTTLGKDGNHEIKLSAADIVKNSASTFINVIVDNTPPIIQLSPPNGAEFYSDQNLTIAYDVTDATSGVTSSSVSLDGFVVSKGDIIDLRNLSVGSHVIQVTATDNAGNNADASTTFMVKSLPAIVEIEPHTLNINSSGSWIQAKIQIPGYNANQIDILSIRLNGAVLVESKPNEIEEEDIDEDGSELKVKFNRTQIQSIVSSGDVTLYISGKVNGAAFAGDNTIRVIENKKMDTEKENEEYEKDNKNKGGKT